MKRQSPIAVETQSPRALLLEQLIEKSSAILIKKLANNDRDWADNPRKHQAGVYIPVQERDSGFFPPLDVKPRPEGGGVILHIHFPTVWRQVSDEVRKDTHLVNYRSKGEETHMTRVPKEAFSGLLPSSFLLMGKVAQGGAMYECLTIDSGSDEAILLADLFDLGPEFKIGIFDPAAVRAKERDRILDFAERVIAAWMDGQIATFAAAHATMPSPNELAKAAQDIFKARYGLNEINPFALEAPGDSLREISRSIEWELFREYQRRERSVEIVRLIMGDTPGSPTPAQIIRRLVNEYPALDAVLLSASQQRKSRAGNSYEFHIETMLTGGGVPFEKQVIIEAKKRPDFILPSLKFTRLKSPEPTTGLILSAKTTLRERWKQVEREKGDLELYLTTVDENIAGNAIRDMASIGVNLVVPESLKEISGKVQKGDGSKAKRANNYTEYAGHANVLTFKEFCEKVVGVRLSGWTTTQI